MDLQNDTDTPTYTGLNETETAVLIALLQPGTVSDAAKKAGVSRATVYRYMANDHFKTALRAAQDEAIETAISLLSGAARDAADTLIQIHTDKTVPAAVRVQASRAILTEFLKVREQHELSERLAKIEQLLGARNG